MKIRWSPRSIDRIIEIGDYIAKDSPLTALRVMKSIFESVERLELFPKSGRIVPEFGNPEIREVIHNPYRILYQEFENAVEILTVIHSRQLLTGDSI
jgi:toxin ParE1/3/4